MTGESDDKRTRTALRAYAGRLLTPAAAGEATTAALARGGTGAELQTAIRAEVVARIIAAERTGPRMRRGPKNECAAVPTLLREDAEQRLVPVGRERLDALTAECDGCADLRVRFEAAESELRRVLTGKRAATALAVPAGVVKPLAEEPPGAPPARTAAVPERASPEFVAPRTHGPAHPTQQRTSRMPALIAPRRRPHRHGLKLGLVTAAFLLVAGGATAAVLTNLDDDSAPAVDVEVSSAASEAAATAERLRAAENARLAGERKALERAAAARRRSAERRAAARRRAEEERARELSPAVTPEPAAPLQATPAPQPTRSPRTEPQATPDPAPSAQAQPQPTPAKPKPPAETPDPVGRVPPSP